MNGYKTLITFTLLWIVISYILKLSYWKKHKKYYYIFSTLLLTVIFGFRQIDSVYGGNDSTYYVHEFLNIKTLFSDSQSEILYKCYVFLIRSITNNYRMFILLNTFFLTAAFLYFVAVFFYGEKNLFTLYLLWPVFIYYTCNTLRNGFSISICLLSIISLKKRKTIQAFLLGFIAVLFHYSAVFFVAYLVYFIVYDMLRKIHVPDIVIIAGAIIVLISAIPVLSKVFYSSRYAFFAENSSSSILGVAPYYLIGILALKLSRNLLKNFNHKECMYGTFFCV